MKLISSYYQSYSKFYYFSPLSKIHNFNKTTCIKNFSNNVIPKLQGPTKRHDWLAKYEWGDIDVSNQPMETNYSNNLTIQF